VARDQAPPLSFAQERLWFLEQLEPGSSAYNICRAARLTGPLNVEVLESSLNEIARRHEVMRTTFQIADGQPAQVIASELQGSIKLIELFRLSNAESDTEVGRLIAEEADRPFDLCAGPLLRATLLRLRDDDHILILTTHHIVSDAWSMGIFTRELWTLYGAYANGRLSSLKELPVQYADYAVWQREWLQGEVLESQLSYWRKQLENLPVLNLPTDRPRPAQQSYLGARQPITLSESLTIAVNELSKREGVTQFMTLLAAFYVLLYRYSGQEDVAVGSPIANRNRTELEGLIGFFVNTLVLRTDLSEEPAFKELLLRVRDVCLGAYAHQDLPFERLVRELQPERDVSRNPLFQVMFVLQNAPRSLAEISDLGFRQIETEHERSQFDLSLFLRERDGRLIGFFEYSTDLFGCATIERMAGHFQMLLEGIVADPDQPILAIPLLTETERHQLLVEWNDTAADYPKSCCIQELFEEQVERTPDATPVRFEGEQLTYRELNARANQLARYLLRLGVGPEKRVGICVERSLEMVVGLLGILKAGGAYVPLDPGYPSGRLEFMLNDAQVSVLLTQKPLVRQLSRTEALAVCLDDLTFFDQENKENLTRATDAESAAYVIYTSGSTGTPKGVVGLHRGAVNRFAWMWSTYPFRANEMSCVKTSLSFVDSVWEVFGPLLKGIPSTIIPDQVAKDPQLLIQTLADNHVTRIVLVPSLLKAILDVDRNLQSHLPDLKLWTSSGEPLSKELAERFYQCLPNSKLLNLYGSSEVSADATCYETRKTESSGRISIGRPIHNTQIYLLDSHLQPVPIGISGEICVGGAGLAWGYLNRPQLTAERFIPNAFSDEPRSRLYRTGDLARYLSNGNIEFLGRVDNQVKIRGCRIEPAEVETVLNQHPAVRESVVVADQGTCSAERRLVAYLVSTDQPSPSANQLRGFLKDKLPEFMVPSVFVALETLPLMPNGKVDRGALPLPENARLELENVFVGPRTEAEQLVAQVWREVLKVEKIGVHDNFFELGGHSVTATQVIGRLRDAFRAEVPLRFLFETPTIAELTQKIETLNGQEADLSFPSIVRVSREGSLPLSISQEQLWDFDQMIPGNHLLNIPYVFHLTGTLDTEALADALREIIGRHEVLRTVFAKVDGRPVQVIRPVPEFQLPFIDLRNLDVEKMEEQAAVLTLEERTQPFDLSVGPLLRTKLVRLTDEDYLLLVTLHHIVGDRWSILVLRRELAQLYEAFSQKQPSPLPDLPIQFADFALWERRLMESELMQTQLTYWKNQLTAPLPKLAFQKVRRRNKRLSFRTGRKAISVEKGLFAAVKSLASKENCTPFMIMMAALNVVLHAHTGEQDIRVGTLVANRRLRETENLIGYFVNAVVLRTRLKPDMNWKDLLKQVREVTLGAYAHQELPFGRLAHALDQEGNVKGDSLIQVLLNYQNLSFPPAEFPGLTLAVLDFQQAKLDSEMALTAVDLIFDLRETSTKLTGSVNYRSELFDDHRVASLIRVFHEALKAMVKDPNQVISVFRSNGWTQVEKTEA
jgi:amino acid adenylation domain-containing protein